MIVNLERAVQILLTGALALCSCSGNSTTSSASSEKQPTNQALQSQRGAHPEIPRSTGNPRYATVENREAGYGVSASSIRFPKGELSYEARPPLGHLTNYILVYFTYADATNTAVFEADVQVLPVQAHLKGYTGGGGLSAAVLQEVDPSMPAAAAKNLYAQWNSTPF
jgi:hypothetical protein